MGAALRWIINAQNVERFFKGLTAISRKAFIQKKKLQTLKAFPALNAGNVACM
jgi:ribosomal protein L15E